MTDLSRSIARAVAAASALICWSCGVSIVTMWVCAGKYEMALLAFPSFFAAACAGSYLHFEHKLARAK